VRPPILSDAAIRAAIRELAAGGARLTGVAVRELLAARYGARGGVTRIYRLLEEFRIEARTPGAARPAAPISPESREAAIARADLAEHRERTHQERWARETDALRARLAAAEQAARDAEVARHRIGELTRALSSAQARIAQLEHAQDGHG
jgi:hypothetical protein